MLHKCLKALVPLVVVAAAPLAAQDAIIRGTVTSDRGEAVQVASVQIPELTVQVFTGADGRYSLLVPAARVRGQTVTLRVRAIGHKPASRVLTLNAGEQTLDFTLAIDVNMLEAIVVTGVQEAIEQKKTGFAVTRIDVGNLPLAASDPLKQLQGKLGSNIVSASGRPGASPAVLLRGPTSLNASGRSQDPLYIVDGVVINGDLSSINPQDIESVEVVKGAAGSSMYGARAGNGVISITTKSGSRALEGVKFTARTEAGTSDIERDFGLARYHALLVDETGQRFCQFVSGQPLCGRTFDYRIEAARVNNQPGDFAGSPPGFPIDPGSTITQTIAGRTGNVLKETFQTMPWPGTSYNAVAQTIDPQAYLQNSLDLTGRIGGTRFYTSAANTQEQGAIRFLDGFQRNSFRANVDQLIGTNWSIGIRTFYSRTSEDGVNQEGGNAFFRLTRVPAIVDILQRDTLGRLYIRPNLQGGGSQNENPLSSLQQTDRTDIASRFIGGVTATFTPVSWASIETSVGYDSRRTTFAQVSDKGFRTTTSSPAANNGSLQRGAGAQEAFDASINASIRRDLTPDLRARMSARYLFEQRDDESSSGFGNTLSVKGVNALDNATANLSVTSSFTRVRQIGQFLGAGLEFKERYILDGLVRRDGSSLFGEGNRWATFGRVSGAWRLAQESWWFLPQLTEAKLRASYGTAGGSPRFSAQYETIGIGNGGLLTLGVQGNRLLQPELHKEVELGADIEILGRYGVQVTYARSNIERQILQVPVPSSTGYSSQWQNAGALLNITHELTVNIPVVQGRALNWSMSLVYDHNRSFITQLGVPPYFYGPPQQGATQMFRAAVGEQIGTFYGRYFLRSCSELPAPFSGDCGTPGAAYQHNDQGYVVWVGAGNTPDQGITHNLWETQLPDAQAPWGAGLGWGMPIIMRGDPLNQRAAKIVKLGNALPDFRFAITQSVSFKKFSLYALLDAAIGHQVWNEGFHWAHLDFLSDDVDQAGKPVTSAKPIGYYWRAPAADGFTGTGGFYDVLGPNSQTVEDASYAKLRELTVGYRFGQIAGFGDWELSIVGRNLLTITGYRGFDPETGRTGGDAGSSAVNAVDAFQFPNLRTFTVRLASTF